MPTTRHSSRRLHFDVGRPITARAPSTPSGRSLHFRPSRRRRSSAPPPIAECLVRLKCIVRSAPELKVLYRRRPAQGKRDDVMELQSASLRATPFRTLECAKTLIPSPDLAPYWSWHVPVFRERLLVARPRNSWARHEAEFVPLRLLDQQGQGPIHDSCGVAVWDRMPQQVPRLLQLVVRLLADCHSDQIAPRREWRDDVRTARWNGRRRLEQQIGRQGRRIAMSWCGFGGCDDRPSGKRPNTRRDIGLGMERRHEPLDFPLALEPGGVKERCVILVGQMRREKSDCRQ